MDAFHGSVMHVLELANFLAKKHEIYIITTYINRKVRINLDADIHIIEIDKITEPMTFDLIWSYHFPLLGSLLRNEFVAKRIICGSLSSFEELETFPLFWKLCSALHCVSEEAALAHCKNYNIPLEKIRIMENVVPLNYTLFQKEALPKKPVNIAIVSNYAPKELTDLKQKLEPKIRITYYGGNRNIFITPEILIKHDLIITIGKTVQYALALGIPVYNYGRFGGDGYITKANFSFERTYNFSGRPNNRKLTPDKICEEIFSQYILVSKNAKDLQEIARKNFLVSNSLNRFLSDYESLPIFDFKALQSYHLYLSQCDSFTKYLCRCHHPRTKYTKKPFRVIFKLVRKFLALFTPPPVEKSRAFVSPGIAALELTQIQMREINSPEYIYTRLTNFFNFDHLIN